MRIGCLIIIIFIAIGLIVSYSIKEKLTPDKKPKAIAQKPKEQILEIRICPRNGINIRKGPGIKYEKRGQLKKGDRIFILEEKEGWMRFRITKADESSNLWVKKDLTTSKAKWDLDRYSTEIGILQKKLGIRLIERISVSDNAATLTVSNLWHIRNYQIRLQDAQVLWEMWASINNPWDRDKSRIILVDFNGNRVGGSSWAGSIIKVKKY